MPKPNNITKPHISVVMPVFNVEKFIKEALNSILEQTYTNFELIAINDGSPDNSLQILKQYAKADERIRVISQDNQGLVATLNHGISLARGEYIARMDPDDVSFPRRFEQQVEILDTKPEVVLVAGGFEVIDEDSEFLYREVLPVDSDDIKRSMLLRNPIAHGSVMFRKSTFEKIGQYSDSCGPMEDFYLWTQMARLGDIEAVEPAIYRWRVNQAGITSTMSKKVIEATNRHIDTLWLQQPPQPLGALELRRRGQHYFKTYKKRGVDMKNIVWTDNARLGVKMIRRGRLLKGAYQLLSVAVTGRAGVRTVVDRFSLIARESFHALRRLSGARR